MGNKRRLASSCRDCPVLSELMKETDQTPSRRRLPTCKAVDATTKRSLCIGKCKSPRPKCKFINCHLRPGKDWKCKKCKKALQKKLNVARKSALSPSSLARHRAEAARQKRERPSTKNRGRH